MHRKTILAVLATAAFVLSGCVSYSGGALRALSDRNLVASEITVAMCADFASASQSTIHGDDKAWPLLGKASELTGLSVALSKHSIQCFSAIDRLGRETNPMSEFNHGALLQIFKRSWANTKYLAGEEE